MSFNIYIPLWLNIKSFIFLITGGEDKNLHSTLIKYKGHGSVLKNVESVKFTFHSD